MIRRSARLLPGVVAIVLLACVVPALAVPLSAQEEQRAFDAFDTNHDGKISRDEFELNKIQVLFRRQETSSGSIDRQIRITRAQSRLAPEIFDAFDRSGDGVLTGEEIISSDMLNFEAMDTNGDGFIDRQEFHALIIKLFH